MSVYAWWFWHETVGVAFTVVDRRLKLITLCLARKGELPRLRTWSPRVGRATIGAGER